MEPAPPVPVEKFPGFAAGLALACVYFVAVPLAFAAGRHLDPTGGWSSWLVQAAGGPAAIAIILVIVRCWLPIPWQQTMFLTGRPTTSGVGKTVALALLALSTSIGLLSLIFHYSTISAEDQELLETFWQTHGNGAIVLSLMVAVVIGPICEELLFRGLLLGSFLRRYGPTPAIVLSAALFTIGHLSAQWPNTLLMALVLGWWIVRTRVLVYAFVFHMIWNGVVSLLPRSFRMDPSVLPLHPALFLAGCGSLALSFLIWRLVRSEVVSRAAD